MCFASIPTALSHTTSRQRLASIGSLNREPGDQQEFDGLVRSGRVRLADPHLAALSQESRFDLAYNASHAFALAALRWCGYRSENRYIVFQCLTLPTPWPSVTRCGGGVS